MPDHLGVRLLGDFRLDGPDVAAVRSRKARTVLKVLALARGDPVSSDRLVDAVWPDGLPTDPERDLAVLVSRIRALLGGERVARSPAGYTLLADWCDCAEVESLTRDAAARQARGDAVGARAAAESALALVRGPLLADEPDAPWCVGARREAAAVAAEARALAAGAALATGSPLDAQLHARAALEHDPYDEAAVRTLMRAHVAAGRPASALQEFAALRTRLRDELGVSPSPETDRLHAIVLRGDAEPGAAVAPGPAVVGRRAELARLDAALARAAGGLVVVEVVGETGIGKSLLIRAWAGLARRAGATVLVGTAVAGTGIGLQPVVDAIDAVEAVDSVDDALPALPGRAAAPEALRRSRFRRLDRVLDRLAGTGPLAIVIDDVHHADPLTIGWLSLLTQRPEDHAFLVVVARPDGVSVPIGAATGRATAGRRDVITLGPFSEAEAAELVGSDRAAALWARTGGNPLLLAELATTTDDDSVPATVRDAVSVRLERAGAAGATIRTAAALGPPIDLDLLAAVLDLSPVVVLEHLDEGLRGSFLAIRDGAITFRHDVVREAVAADATPARRAWLHRTAARALADRPGADPLAVARHARAGGDPALAARSLADGAALATSRLDLPAAQSLLTDAIALDDSPGLRLQRARVRIGQADLDGADADADAALGAGGGAPALEIRAWVARNRHDMESAMRLGRAGAAVATDAATKASCLLAVGLALRGVGDLHGADRTLAEAVALDPPSELGLGAWVGVLRVHQGRPAEALDALLPQVGAEGGGLLSFWVEHVLQMTAHAFGLVGRVDDAMALLDRLDRELDRRGTVVRYAGVGATYRSWLLRNLGSADAEDHARAAIERPGSPEIRANSTLDLADVLLGSGRLDDAAATHARAVAAMDVRWFHNRWRADQRAGVIAARLALAAGDAADALAAAERVAADAGERGDERYATIATLLGARATARAGQPVDWVRTDRALDRLGDVATPEGWWLAADLAADTGSRHARAVAERLATRLATEAGARAEAFRAVLADRLG